jgi:hypothetical protein
MKSIRTFGVVLAVLVIAGLATPASAATLPIIVGNGTADSCTEAALQNALVTARTEGGGHVRFHCGANPVTIPITAPSTLPDGSVVGLLLPNNTTINGGGQITLTHVDWPGFLLLVDVGSTVHLANLTLESTVPSYSGYSDTNDYGTLLNRGTLVVRGATMLAGYPVMQIVNSGTLDIKNSTVSGDYGAGGDYERSALSNYGSARINQSAFANNSSSMFGGAIDNYGLLDVNNSVFTGNMSFQNGRGGAINNFSSNNWHGTVIVHNSEFSNNRADYGGAISSNVPIKVTDSSFSENWARIDGGAISSSGVVAMDCTFIGNRTLFLGGAGGAIQAGTLNMANSTVSGNSADTGGGISASNSVTLADSHITSNTATFHGGGIALGPTGSLKLKRTDVVNNTPDDIYMFPSSSSILTEGVLATTSIER